MQKKILLIAVIVLAIALLWSLGRGCGETGDTCPTCVNGEVGEDNGCSEEELKGAAEGAKSESAAFFEEYVDALNDIHAAGSYIEVANANLVSGEDFRRTVEYDYDSLNEKYGSGRDQALKAKNHLSEAKKTLNGILETAPNAFFEGEVEARLEQVQLYTDIAGKLDSLLENASQQLYEINFGSDQKAVELSGQYSVLVTELNTVLEELGELRREWSEGETLIKPLLS